MNKMSDPSVQLHQRSAERTKANIFLHSSFCSLQASSQVSQLFKNLFLKDVYLNVQIPLREGYTPHPCTVSSSCPVQASDGGSYTSSGYDWDSHSTEHQAMRKLGQAAN